MFHLQDNIFFGRIHGKADHEGSIRILALKSYKASEEEWPRADGVYPNALLDVTTTPNALASVIASLSQTGETSAQYEKALNLLNS